MFARDDFTHSSKRIKGTYSQCLAVDVVPLGFQATSQTSGGSKEANCDGGGSKEANCDGEIGVPHTREDSDFDTLIDCIFPRQHKYVNKNYITSRAILSTWNEMD